MNKNMKQQKQLIAAKIAYENADAGEKTDKESVFFVSWIDFKSAALLLNKDIETEKIALDITNLLTELDIE